MEKILVVYYSHSGNTRYVAKQIGALTKADVFEVVPEVAYPRDYQTVVEQARQEIAAGVRPKLQSDLADTNVYDVILVGSPCWWSTVAPPIATFLQRHQFDGKTIVPFMTHEGSGMGRTESDLRKLCPGATVAKGLPIRGGSVKTANSELTSWLTKLGLCTE